MYIWLGTCVGLSLLLAAYLAASCVGAGVWRLLGNRAARWSGVRRASLLFRLRIFPAVIAIVLVACVVTPAYLLFEPHETGEKVSPKLLILAGLTVACILSASWRTFLAWLDSRRLVREWMQTALFVPGQLVPVYEFERGLPLICISGILRPRVFVARKLMQCMQPEEIAAAIRHEKEHLNAKDNLRRLLLHLLPDATRLFGARGLNAAWSEAAEIAADARAVRSDPQAALDLASALIKAARLAPARVNPCCSSFVGVPSGLALRVQLLTAIDETGIVRKNRQPAWWRRGAVGVALLVALYTLPSCLHAVHECIEVFVRFLS